ncbi:MAG: aminotransferase class V-fold PLP-dependent enzyme [Planctomycetes bacterium]|nr:aminotransferase class V-fold PLP-dependent enzyme [Planctomycetota bacterium]
MMQTRRQFMGSMSVPAIGLAVGTLAPTPRADALAVAERLSRVRGQPDDLARDETYWAPVGRAFTVDRSIVNLNNGGVSPSPAFVQDAMKRHLDYSNTCPPYAMWRVLEPQREGVRDRMARQWGVDPEEIAFTRNASESLQICQFGIDLRAGDEVLTTTQDYPRMLNTFRQRERREGIRLVEIEIPVPAEDEDEIVRLFERAITPRTRVILMCHVINLTGQILPVRKVCDMAHTHGVPVIVDGAHSLAHFEFKLSDLNCDYFGTSLHKWLFAPHGTGLLYMKRELIKQTWPMMAANETQDDDIRKFEEIGTHPAANTLAVAEALTFHQGIGPARKEARMRYLRDYWAKVLLEHDRVRLHTSLDPRFSCGIATVEVDGLDSGELSGWLWSKHRILVTSIKHAQFEGIRVSPSVYSSLEELDRFCDAVQNAIADGLS